MIKMMIKIRQKKGASVVDRYDYDKSLFGNMQATSAVASVYAQVRPTNGANGEGTNVTNHRDKM